MKIGCHAVLFREKIKEETEDTIEKLASTGFSGSEIGSRFFGTEDKEELLEILNKHNYQITGMHIGGPLEDWCNLGDEMLGKILSVAEFVKDMPNKNVVMSTKPFEGSKDELVQAAKNIEKAANRCQEMGVALNLHNHAWEFENNALIFNALVKYAPSLKLGLDLGWVYVAGYDPIEIVKEYAHRINYVHLRDANEDKEFVELGEGVFDYSQLMTILKEVLDENGWAVAEYEHGDQDINRYIRAYEFLIQYM